MKKNIKTKKEKKPRATRQKKPRVTRQQQKKKEKDNVNVNIIRIDQSKKSLNRTKGVSQPRQQPYIPIPPIMINPSTQTSPQINPFAFSDIKDAVRNVLGESINNRQSSVQIVGEDMQNPYGMKTPSQNTLSKLYQSIPKSEEDTTFGGTYENKNLFDDTEQENIKVENESLSSIFPNLSNEQSLTAKLNISGNETPDNLTLSKKDVGNPRPQIYNDKNIKRNEKELKKKEIEVARGLNEIYKIEKKKEKQKQEEALKNKMATPNMTNKELRTIYYLNFNKPAGKMNRDELIFKINTKKK